MKKTGARLAHVALVVKNLEDCAQFYIERFGMKIDWQPDIDNVYLTSGHDNLALHRASAGFDPVPTQQRLDHLGFFLNTLEEVDEWHADFEEHGVQIIAKPKTHRDNSRSFYCKDPDGNIIQIMHVPSVD